MACRIMSDNGSAYKSFAVRDLLAEHGIKHKRTRPYTPRTNGKAERFIQTSLREWAYAEPFVTSAARADAMQLWLTAYNTTRPHSALGGQSPLIRLTGPAEQTLTKPRDTSDTEPGFVGLGIGGDNVLGNDI
jgi:transposase InsO family protein